MITVGPSLATRTNWGIGNGGYVGEIAAECQEKKGGKDLPAAVNDPAAAQVVGRNLHLYPVAGDDADKVFAHAARDVGNDLVAVVQFDAELRVGERFFNAAFDFDGFFFWHNTSAAR